MGNMMQQILLAFFQQFLNGQIETLERIRNFNGDIFVDQATGSLVFSLIALHEFLADQHVLSFSEFKRMLYKGEFNRTLRGFGGKVTIYRSNGKIDDNLYQLTSLNN